MAFVLVYIVDIQYYAAIFGGFCVRRLFFWMKIAYFADPEGDFAGVMSCGDEFFSFCKPLVIIGVVRVG